MAFVHIQVPNSKRPVAVNIYMPFPFPDSSALQTMSHFYSHNVLSSQLVSQLQACPKKHELSWLWRGHGGTVIKVL